MNCIISENVECKVVLINGKLLEVYSDGRIYRFNKKNDKLIVENTNNHSEGYNKIFCNYKMIFRHRIIGFAFLGLDINNTTQCIDHRDGNKLNNSLSNLRIVTNHQNLFNQTKAKGYYWHKPTQKYLAQIGINGKGINLGYYATEQQAREAYLKAKLFYHKIN